MREVTMAAAAALVICGLFGGRARAEDVVELELTVPLAWADRSVAGATPASFGYANQAGLSTGGEARLYVGERNRYFHLGAVVGAQHMAGPLLGAVEGHAFRSTYVDAGLAARALFPCMSGGDTRWHLSGILALTGVHADAGLGVGVDDNGPLYPERRAAADALDHAGLGWRLAFDLSVHQASFVAGLALGVRQYFGIDSPVARGWVMDVGLRVGGRIDLFGGEAEDERRRFADYE
jgi:hypothetical protein